MNTAEILKGAKALPETKGWTQGELATTSSGMSIGPMSRSAACFCSIGAIRRVVGEAGDIVPAKNALVDAIGTERRLGAVIKFNDAPGRTVEEVLAKFDKAIAAEEAKLSPA